MFLSSSFPCTHSVDESVGMARLASSTLVHAASHVPLTAQDRVRVESHPPDFEFDEGWRLRAADEVVFLYTVTRTHTRMRTNTCMHAADSS